MMIYFFFNKFETDSLDLQTLSEHFYKYQSIYKVNIDK
jgi:hypothetical protein